MTLVAVILVAVAVYQADTHILITVEEITHLMEIQQFKMVQASFIGSQPKRL